MIQANNFYRVVGELSLRAYCDNRSSRRSELRSPRRSQLLLPSPAQSSREGLLNVGAELLVLVQQLSTSLEYLKEMALSGSNARRRHDLRSRLQSSVLSQASKGDRRRVTLWYTS